ncbi:hypothetical protein RhiirA5_442775 [Rhizophagus irregularis]|uniref:Uncharacterized protein n=2 Tax=Rhizophagus irregularis TaxID=588596 RepID=A0A2N0NEI0_9GLOM|nr:hypothetical protein GLOIN_2v1791750 [Rhizophagus irregularis DAOM 181602=DAOM 197198]PKB92970.1 hypothetical protein RhiirA5_442775 [Rhizophagus irregularis]POG57091.1 hypothetical protein GLOIN_2v1791750 [Rhizophagus irregularis DAOM 181602=DAOM 197198]CAB5210842.1 unnamed protein product [Rhizophagus irregularis]CAB5380342.1 unnamed protein product [Rhizophagus irregularis]GET49967.1 hypothetical protein GLOIN_2v1791750 [Rhizophagus irregularis DAOM 181602=DAOM 197198]|eukprot:XP_025164374.1 hypothetical protein GLOIN_2v1791750 [Rhizophagus irregularis DAOM 181602=DAOM 197198]
MSTERTIEIRLQSEDNYIDIIDIKNLTSPENLIPPLENTNSIKKYTKNAFDKLLNKKNDLNFLTKSKEFKVRYIRVCQKLRNLVDGWGSGPAIRYHNIPFMEVV